MSMGGRTRRSGWLTLGFWLALVAAGCGGRSIRDDGEAAGDEDQGGQASALQSCLDACEEAATCARAPYECGFFCGQAEIAATEAGCLSAYTALVQCLRHAEDPCAARGSCVTAVNAFGVCIIDYCDSHLRAPICGG